VRPSGQRVGVSGYARRLASEQGVDLATISSSRADGLITSRDLVNAPKGAVSPSHATSSWVPAPGTINATPSARKLALENNLDIKAIKGTGNFNRVTKEDVLKAAGKWVPEPSTAPLAAPAAAAAAAPAAAKSAASAPKTTVLDGIVPMDGMQKAVAKNMEKTLEVPVFRVSREIFTDDFDALYAELKPKGVTVSSLLAKVLRFPNALH
jgi:pyruvate dehydrogenase E2 component (dihydrolipoamide acetyltransferase)